MSSFISWQGGDKIQRLKQIQKHKNFSQLD